MQTNKPEMTKMYIMQKILNNHLYINRGRYVPASVCPRVAAKPRAAKPRVRVSRQSRLATLRAGTASSI